MGLTMGMKRLLTAALLCLIQAAAAMAQVWQYVDPRIGSVGVGRTFPGPSMPFGMCKPGPDCGVLPNAGWAPMPERVSGFSQTHVSGTGGGQKYGNILILPFTGRAEPQVRKAEDFALGYYATTFESGVTTEITASERCAFYRISYPQSAVNAPSAGASLLVDATHFLGKNPVPDLRERQQFVGAEVEVVSKNEVRGFSRVRGGWNNGDAYTVYFCLLSDKPLLKRGAEARRGAAFQADISLQEDPGSALFSVTDTLLNIKVGISYVSCRQARSNIPACGFDEQTGRLRQSWEQLLSRIDLKGELRQKRMFYTALYHTMLMPVDKTGENPKWTDSPYYDDYYAIWDTYRTSTPLITLIDEKREADIVNSLLNIYRREGFMPDARSGDCNGRTQGGSNAEVVIADAYAKGLQGIDYELALEAMLKDGEADPGAEHEKHGRGGLTEYLRLGYIPYGTDRAGNRTMEYAYDDYCIAQVARGLGLSDVFERYIKRSEYWKNLWRDDYEWGGMRGFIMPKDETGRWLDSVEWGKSKVFHPQIPYTPVTKVAPWYLPWWSTFFYEALSAEYSLSVPHDVPALISRCGGEDAFRKRLDTFFDEGHYNVQNEPSFLTPCLYHWIGRPDLSTQRAHAIVETSYSDAPDGLPGNDDSGAMSSWLAFHIMGFYPNAGQDYYLLTAPMVPEYTFYLCNGKSLHVKKACRQGGGAGQKVKGEERVRRILLNGRVVDGARISHAELMEGGTMVFETERVKQHKTAYKPQKNIARQEKRTNSKPFASFDFHYTLNRQFRTWPVSFAWKHDTLEVVCNKTTYLIPQSVVENGDRFCWLIPSDGYIYNKVEGTFGFISQKAMHDLQVQNHFVYDGITWRKTGENSDGTVCVRADIDGTEMLIRCIKADGGAHDFIPLVVAMHKNPLGIDWNASPR